MLPALLQQILSEGVHVEGSDIFRDESNDCLLTGTGRGVEEDDRVKRARVDTFVLALDFMRLAVEIGEWGRKVLRKGVWEEHCPHCPALKPYHEKGCRWKALFKRAGKIRWPR